MHLGAGATIRAPITARADFIQAGLGIVRAIESRSAEVASSTARSISAASSLPIHVGTRLQ